MLTRKRFLLSAASGLGLVALLASCGKGGKEQTHTIGDPDQESQDAERPELGSEGMGGEGIPDGTREDIPAGE